MTHFSRSFIGEASLIGVAAVWGLTFPMVQDAVALVPVTTFLAYRFTIAAVVVGAVSTRHLRSLSAPALRAGLLMGACLTAGYLFQTFGLQRTSASNAGFITGLFVVLTPIFGAPLLGHRAGPIAWTAAGVSAGGLALLSGLGSSDGNLAGDGLVFGCACSFALHILATGVAVKEHNVLGLLVVQLAMCGIVCGVAAAAMGDLSMPRGATVWGALAITSLVASALGFFIQTYAQRNAPPARTALILASEPAFAGLFAYLLKGETLDGLQWLGAGLILAAIVSVELFPHLRPPHPVPEA